MIAIFLDFVLFWSDNYFIFNLGGKGTDEPKGRKS